MTPACPGGKGPLYEVWAAPISWSRKQPHAQWEWGAAGSAVTSTQGICTPAPPPPPGPPLNHNTLYQAGSCGCTDSRLILCLYARLQWELIKKELEYQRLLREALPKLEQDTRLLRRPMLAGEAAAAGRVLICCCTQRCTYEQAPVTHRHGPLNYCRCIEVLAVQWSSFNPLAPTAPPKSPSGVQADDLHVGQFWLISLYTRRQRSGSRRCTASLSSESKGLGEGRSGKGIRCPKRKLLSVHSLLCLPRSLLSR